MKFSLLLLALSLSGVSSYYRPPYSSSHKPHQSQAYNIPVPQSQGNQNQPWWFGKTSMGKPVIGVTADGKPVTEESLKTIHRNLAPAYQLGEFSDFQAGSSESSEENKGYTIRMSRGKPVRVPIARDSSGDDSPQQISPSTNTGRRRTSMPYVPTVVRSQPPPAPRQPYQAQPTYTRRQAPVPSMSSIDSTEQGGRYIIRMSRGRQVRVPVSGSGSYEDSSVESSKTNSVSSPSPSRQLYRANYRTSNTHITRPLSDRRVQLPSHSSNVDESSEESGNYVIRMSRGKPVRVKVPASGGSSADSSQFGEAFKPGKTVIAGGSSGRDSSGEDSLETDSSSAQDNNKSRGIMTYQSPVSVHQHRGALSARPWQSATRQHTKPGVDSTDDSSASDSSSTDGNHHAESDESSEESGSYVIRMSRGKPVKVRVSGSSSADDDSSTSNHHDQSSESLEHSSTMKQRGNQKVYSPPLSPIAIQQPRATYSARPWGSVIRQPVQNRPEVKIISTTRRPIRTRPPRVNFTTPRPVTKQPVRTTQPHHRPPVKITTTRRPIRTRAPQVQFTTPRTVIFTTAPVRFRPGPTAGPTFVIPQSSSSESFEEQPNQQRQTSLESQSSPFDSKSSEELQPIHRQISIESQSATIDFETSLELSNQRLSVIENQSSEEEVHQMRQQVHHHNPSPDSNESHSDES